MRRATHTVVQPGDRIEFDRDVESAGRRRPADAGERCRARRRQPNPYCAAYTARRADPAENAQSVGTHFTFGRFRALHMGDLTWNKEIELMCPANRLGEVDLFVVSHHGQAISNSPVLVHALQPRVAVINNGTRKGGQPDAMKVLYSAPGLEGCLAAALLAAERTGIHGARACSSRTAWTSSRRRMPIAPIAAPGAAAHGGATARPQRPGVLDQGVGVAKTGRSP